LSVGKFMHGWHRGTPETIGNSDIEIGIGRQAVLSCGGSKFEQAFCKVSRLGIKKLRRSTVAIALDAVTTGATPFVDRMAEREHRPVVFRSPPRHGCSGGLLPGH